MHSGLLFLPHRNCARGECRECGFGRLKTDLKEFPCFSSSTAVVKYLCFEKVQKGTMTSKEAVEKSCTYVEFFDIVFDFIKKEFLHHYWEKKWDYFNRMNSYTKVAMGHSAPGVPKLHIEIVVAYDFSAVKAIQGTDSATGGVPENATQLVAISSHVSPDIDHKLVNVSNHFWALKDKANRLDGSYYHVVKCIEAEVWSIAKRLGLSSCEGLVVELKSDGCGGETKNQFFIAAAKEVAVRLKLAYIIGCYAPTCGFKWIVDGQGGDAKRHIDTCFRNETYRAHSVPGVFLGSLRHNSEVQHGDLTKDDPMFRISGKAHYLTCDVSKQECTLAELDTMDATDDEKKNALFFNYNAYNESFKSKAIAGIRGMHEFLVTGDPGDVNAYPRDAYCSCNRCAGEKSPNIEGWENTCTQQKEVGPWKRYPLKQFW